MSHWLTRDWWAYLLAPASVRGWTSRWAVVDWGRRVRCRAGGHRPGPIWFNAGGLEPDGRCQGCGDTIL
jgi:hypothetical protein